MAATLRGGPDTNDGLTAACLPQRFTTRLRAGTRRAPLFLQRSFQESLEQQAAAGREGATHASHGVTREGHPWIDSEQAMPA
jgi:hypothetical protein